VLNVHFITCVQNETCGIVQSCVSISISRHNLKKYQKGVIRGCDNKEFRLYFQPFSLPTICVEKKKKKKNSLVNKLH
jgi:hypothetical protein